MLNDSLIVGLVIKGEGRGTSLGFPTANLQLANPSSRPLNGVYACQAYLLPESQPYLAILHVGPRPTFPDLPPSVEVHLIDFPYQQLYGQKISLSDLKYIRNIRKFPSALELIQALKQDSLTAAQIFSSYDQSAH
jgi:riboflavin kinase/FMN adenylyltransferase